ncbi:MAG: phosphate ABC transporter ATP-binding protein [Archangium sp.]|nr:phosphate ABC transporter ATP-binding protein [Archangium sp.]
MNAPSVHVRDLNLWFGTFQALKHVSFEVPSRGVTALIGPSGCGKTTLLRSFNRLNERAGEVKMTGHIELLGKDILAPDVSLATLRKHVGMVFQRPNPLPLEVRENVLFGLRAHVPPRELTPQRLDEAVESSLRAVGLWDAVKDKLHHHATELSLEQQQKLCIARLLPLKPSLILMDEPCSALDTEGITHVEALIAQLEEDFPILMVTHSMAQARRVSDECLYMLMGEIIEHGPTEELFTAPKDERTALYVAGRYA